MMRESVATPETLKREISMKSMIVIGCVVMAGLLTLPAERAVDDLAVLTESGMVVAQLVQIDERRRREIVKQDDSFSAFNKPGLELTFALDLPDGQKVLEIAQPAQITAVDARGNDLTKIEKSFMGDLEYVEVVQSFNEPAEKFNLKLTTAARDAATFDCTTTIVATTYRETKPFTLKLTDELTPVDPGELDGRKVKAKFSKGSGMFGDDEDGMSVTFRPAEIRPAVEAIYLVKDGREIESNSSMWSDGSVTYFFEGTYDPAYRVKVMLHTGLSEMPIKIDLKNKQLP